MSRYRLKRTTPPTLEPITVAEAMAHCRMDTNSEEAWMTSAIETARQWIEDRCNVTLLTTGWTLTLDDFPNRCGAASALDIDRIILPRCPVQSVTAITYVDTDGTTQTIDSADYTLDAASDIDASVGPAFGETWPTVRDQRNAVVVTYVAGWTLPALVPQAFRHAMRLLVGHWNENREATLTGTISKEIEFAVEALVGPHSLTSVG